MRVQGYSAFSKLILAFCDKCQLFIGASESHENLLLARRVHRCLANLPDEREPVKLFEAEAVVAICEPQSKISQL